MCGSLFSVATASGGDTKDGDTRRRRRSMQLEIPPQPLRSESRSLCISGTHSQATAAKGVDSLHIVRCSDPSGALRGNEQPASCVGEREF